MQGKTPAAAVRLVNDALALEQAGAYAVVLECVPLELAKTITERLAIPTIGIGAGPDCDGQVQVFHDLLGFFHAFVPRHAKRYADLGAEITDAVRAYANEVRDGSSRPKRNPSYWIKPYSQRQRESLRGMRPPLLKSNLVRPPPYAAPDASGAVSFLEMIPDRE